MASTGAITLPAMRKLVSKPFAAAVEAVASSGGQIMPPLMGAGAFVMVELTGIPYTGIIAAAVLPALLYFAAIWIGINAFTERFDLKGLAAEDQPALRTVVITTLFFAILSWLSWSGCSLVAIRHNMRLAWRSWWRF